MKWWCSWGWQSIEAALCRCCLCHTHKRERGQRSCWGQTLETHARFIFEQSAWTKRHHSGLNSFWIFFVSSIEEMIFQFMFTRISAATPEKVLNVWLTLPWHKAGNINEPDSIRGFLTETGYTEGSITVLQEAPSLPGIIWLSKSFSTNWLCSKNQIINSGKPQQRSAFLDIPGTRNYWRTSSLADRKRCRQRISLNQAFMV